MAAFSPRQMFPVVSLALALAAALAIHAGPAHATGWHRQPTLAYGIGAVETTVGTGTLSGLSVWRVSAQRRTNRGVHCNGAWPLALLNLLSGNCAGQDLAHRYRPYLELVAGQTPAAQPDVAAPPLRGDAGAVLAEVLHTNGRNPLAVYAAARVCEVPLRSLLVTRMRRGDDSRAGCSFNMMTIITLYLAIFQQHNSVDHFVGMIQRIIASGSTGHAAADGAQEAALVDAVLQQTDWLRTQPGSSSADPLEFFRRAYRHGATLAAVSANQTPDPELAAQRTAARARACPATALTDWVQQRRSGDINEYLFDLTDFMEDRVQPQVWHQATSAWRWEANDIFTFLVVTERDQEAEQGSLIQPLKAWHEGFQQILASSSAAHDNPQAQAAAWLADRIDLTADYLRSRQSSRRVYVAARFRGETVAITEAWISKEDPAEASLEAILVPPGLFREPYADGTVRRAATAAVTRLFGWLHEHGVSTVIAQATSDEADRICSRIAFTFSQLRDFMRDDRSYHSDDEGPERGSDL